MKRYWLFCIALILFSAAGGFSQGAPASLTITAPKTQFIFGEPIKLTVRVRDNAGVLISQPGLSWTVDPAGAATVAPDGTVTALQMQIVVFRAQSGNTQGEIQIQILPKAIVVTPQRDTMTLNSTQVIRAEALDYFDHVIPNVLFRWSLSNLLRNWDTNNPLASIDGSGQMKALVQGRVFVAATLDFSANPAFLNQARGETVVEMRAPLAYEFSRVFAAEAKNATSQVMPRLAQLLATESDGFTFAASLDSIGVDLLRWQNGAFKALLAEGRPHVQTGQPLIDVLAYAANHNGDMMTGEIDATSQTQVSYGTADAQGPLLVPGTPLYIADRTTRFDVQRNSISDSGVTLVQVSYNEVETLRSAVGLFRGTGRGLTEKIVSTLDRLPGFPTDPFSIRLYGVTAEGTAWFTTTIGADNSKYVLWKQKPYGPLERVLGDADAFQGSTVRNIGASGTTGVSQGFFVASNGEVAASVNTLNASYFARWTGDSPTPEVLRATVTGIYWHEPGVGTLINGNVNNGGQGLYLWSATGSRPLLLLNSAFDGSTVTEIQSVTANSHGVIFAMIATAKDPMLIVRLQPDVKVLLRAGDTIPIPVAPVFSAMVRGLRPGPPIVIAGGQTASIGELGPNNTLEPVIAVGDALPGGRIFKGSVSNQVRTLATGEIVFSDTAGGNAVYMWKNGTITILVPNPTTVATGVTISGASAIDVNTKGELVGLFGGAGNGIYLLSNGVLTKVLRVGDLFNGGTVTSLRSPAIDDNGRIAFYVVTDKGESLAIWTQGSLSSVLADGATLSDGRVVKTHDTNIISTNDGFVLVVTLTDNQRAPLRYRTGFEYVVGRNDRTPVGGFLQSTNTWAANRNNGVSLFYGGTNGNNHLIAQRGSSFYEVQDWGEMTPEQDLLVSVTSLFMAFDSTVYALATDDTGQQLIYRGTPINGSVEVPFTARGFGGLSMTTAGAASAVSTGYAAMDARSTLPALAIFSLRQSGVLVSEAAVPASQPITSGRIYAEIAGAVNTGIAMANSGEDSATINYYFTRTDGSQLRSGTLTLAAGRQIATFLNQSLFSSGDNFTGTFSFTSSTPIAVIALRGYTNARGEFLTTTLPVVNLSQTAATTTSVIPNFSSGGGWTTQILLVNPTDTLLTGTLQFYTSPSETSPGVLTNVTVGGQTNNTFSYSVQPRASLKVTLSGAAATTTSGTVRVIPSNGQATPTSLAVFSYTLDGTVVSEAGAAGVAGTSMQMYAEASGVPFSVGSIQTGLAIANPSNQAVSVILELRKLDGNSAGVTALPISIPANGQISKFLFQLFPTLTTPFQGVVRITAASTVFAVGLRGRTNERTHFLITTTPPSPTAAASAPPASLVFPHLVDGGGYTTQIIVIGNGAGDYSGTIQFFNQAGLPLPLTFR